MSSFQSDPVKYIATITWKCKYGKCFYKHHTVSSIIKQENYDEATLW